MRRSVAVPVSEIMSLANCAEDYGHANDVLMDGLAAMLGYELGEDEICVFANSFLTPESRAQGYSEEDADAAGERLRRWREHYFDSARARAFKGEPA